MNYKNALDQLTFERNKKNLNWLFREEVGTIPAKLFALTSKVRI